MIGLWCLWRSGRPLWRALAWAYWLLFVLFAVSTGAKIYYLGAAYVYLLAAGAVAVDGWLQARPGRLRNLLLATAVLTAVTLPVALPVLRPTGLGRTVAQVSPDSLDTVGWPQLVRTVGAVWTSLPPSQQASAELFTDPTARPGLSTSSAGGQGCRPPSAARTAGGGGGPVTRMPPLSWPSRQDRRQRHRLRRLPRPVLHQRPRGGHAVEPIRPSQPAMGRSRLHLHRPSPAMGQDMATAAPLRLTAGRRYHRTRAFTWAGRAAVVRRPGLRHE
jgi:hypothetical protein